METAFTPPACHVSRAGGNVPLLRRHNLKIVVPVRNNVLKPFSLRTAAVTRNEQITLAIRPRASSTGSESDPDKRKTFNVIIKFLAEFLRWKEKVNPAEIATFVAAFLKWLGEQGFDTIYKRAFHPTSKGSIVTFDMMGGQTIGVIKTVGVLTSTLELPGRPQIIVPNSYFLQNTFVVTTLAHPAIIVKSYVLRAHLKDYDVLVEKVKITLSNFSWVDKQSIDIWIENYHIESNSIGFYTVCSVTSADLREYLTLRGRIELALLGLFSHEE